MLPGKRRARGLLVTALVAGACGGSEGRPSDSGLEGQDAASQAAPGSAEAQSYDTARVVAHMGEHFWALGDAHDAAIAGALDGIRQAAHQLATHEPSPDLPQAARPHMASFLEQSRVVARVATLADAGPALSRLAASCGTCHQALGRPLPVLLDDDALDSDDAPRESGTLQEGMSAHIRAADLLWEALVAPSTEAWDAGIALLSDTEIAPEAVTSSESSRNAVAGLLQRLADLAAEGDGASPAERPVLYGQLVMTCGECHRALGRGFGRQDPR